MRTLQLFPDSGNGHFSRQVCQVHNCPKVKEQLKEQKLIVRELANDVEDQLWRKFKFASVLIIAFLGLLGFFGYKTITDFKSKFLHLDSRIAKMNTDLDIEEQILNQKSADNMKRVDDMLSKAVDLPPVK